MTTQKLSDEELERWSVISDRFVMHHVVEIRNNTFSKMLTELRESRKALAKVEELMTALEFYADDTNWHLSGDGYLSKSVSTIHQGDTEIQNGFHVAGSRARLALENWRKS